MPGNMSRKVSFKPTATEESPFLNQQTEEVASKKEYESIPVDSVDDERYSEHTIPTPSRKTPKQLWSVVSDKMSLFRQVSNSSSVLGLSEHAKADGNEDEEEDEQTKESKKVILKSLLIEKQHQQIRVASYTVVFWFGLGLFFYFCLAIIAYSYVFETWDVIDSLFFALTTFTTIGYGDLVPSSIHGKLFTSIFALGGIVFYGGILGVVGSNLIESQIESIQHAQHISAATKLNLFGVASRKDDDELITKKEHETKSATREKEIRLWYRSPILFVTIRISFILLICSLLIRGDEEEWDAVATIYFMVVTATTIGYGDYVPGGKASKLIAFCVIPIMVALLGEILGRAAAQIIERRQAKYRKKMFDKQTLTLRDLDAMSSKNESIVTREDYVTFMLIAMKKVDQELIDELHAQFERLDVDGSGRLTRNTLVLTAQKKLKSSKRKLKLSLYRDQLLSKSHLPIRMHERSKSITGSYDLYREFKRSKSVRDIYESDLSDEGTIPPTRISRASSASLISNNSKSSQQDSGCIYKDDNDEENNNKEINTDTSVGFPSPRRPF